MSNEYGKCIDPYNEYFLGQSCPTRSDLNNENGGLIMKFELGKYYQHTTGHKLYICGLGETYYHGRCFIAENEYGHLLPVGCTQENAVNYHEITKDQFISN